MIDVGRCIDVNSVIFFSSSQIEPDSSFDVESLQAFPGIAQVDDLLSGAVVIGHLRQSPEIVRGLCAYGKMLRDSVIVAETKAHT